MAVFILFCCITTTQQQRILQQQGNITFKLYFVATARQRYYQIIKHCNKETAFHMHYIMLQWWADIAFVLYFVATTRERCYHFILRYNITTIRQRCICVTVYILWCNDKTTLLSRYFNIATMRQYCIRIIVHYINVAIMLFTTLQQLVKYYM